MPEIKYDINKIMAEFGDDENIIRMIEDEKVKNIGEE